MAIVAREAATPATAAASAALADSDERGHLTNDYYRLGMSNRQPSCQVVHDFPSLPIRYYI